MHNFRGSTEHEWTIVFIREFAVCPSPAPGGIYGIYIYIYICNNNNNNTVEPVLTVTCEERSPCIRRSVLKVPTKFSMH